MAMIYTIEAFHPDSRAAPDIWRVAHIAEVVDRVINLAMTNKYAAVSARTPDGLEVIRMWGQLAKLP